MKNHTEKLTPAATAELSQALSLAALDALDGALWVQITPETAQLLLLWIAEANKLAATEAKRRGGKKRGPKPATNPDTLSPRGRLAWLKRVAADATIGERNVENSENFIRLQ